MREEWPLTIVFQPVVELADGRICGYEALGRLRGREEEGFAPLRQWMSEQKSPSRVYRALLELACQAALERPDQTLLFLNVRLRDLAKKPEIPLNWSSVVLEVPESDGRLDHWEQALALWRKTGAQVAIDDWGVGRKDPLRLIRLQPHWIKIDVALIQRVGEPDVDRLIELLVRYAHPTTHLIAEGIESADQLERLRQLGVRYGQGFALARPQVGWPREVPLAPKAKRRADLQRTALALSEAVCLADDDLALIEKSRPLLIPILAEAIDHLVAWIDQTMMRHHLAGENRERYRTIVSQHFDRLLRGSLDMTDVERAKRVARVHQRYGIDLSFYVAGYRGLQAVVAKHLRAQRLTALAEAMRALFSWDMAVVMQAYQELLDRDSLTGVLTRQAFWDRVACDIEQRHQRSRRQVLLVVELDGWNSLLRTEGLGVAEQQLAEIGEMFQAFMTADCLVGQIGGYQFGFWMPAARLRAVQQEFHNVRQQLERCLPAIRLLTAFAVEGRDGQTVDALYQAVDRRLLQVRSTADEQR
ncbi:MAG: EAL domain-containing protein [Firmicutes bacterium]|nr:EAL domain-containing protein [Bacillota bacterium]